MQRTVLLNQTRPARPKKLLYRTEDNRVIAGVAAGMANYLNIDPNLVRFIFILLGLLAGIGVLLYLILWVLIPPRSRLGLSEIKNIQENVKSISGRVNSWAKSLSSPTPTKNNSTLKIILSIIMIVIGIILVITSGIGLLNIFGPFAIIPFILLTITLIILLILIR